MVEVGDIQPVVSDVERYEATEDPGVVEFVTEKRTPVRLTGKGSIGAQIERLTFQIDELDRRGDSIYSEIAAKARAEDEAQRRTFQREKERLLQLWVDAKGKVYPEL